MKIKTELKMYPVPFTLVDPPRSGPATLTFYISRLLEAPDPQPFLSKFPGS